MGTEAPHVCLEGVCVFWSKSGHFRNTATFNFGSMPLKCVSLYLYTPSRGTDLGQWCQTVAPSPLLLKSQCSADLILACWKMIQWNLERSPISIKTLIYHFILWSFIHLASYSNPKEARAEPRWQLQNSCEFRNLDYMRKSLSSSALGFDIWGTSHTSKDVSHLGREHDIWPKWTLVFC